MTTDNRFTPPKAAVADIDAARSDTAQQPQVWTWRGRIGRLRYLSYLMVGYLLFAFGGGLIGGVVSAVGSPVLGGALVAVAMVPYFVLSILALIQRTHDMDWSGWMSLLAFIPLVGLLWLFKPGTKGGNRFGPPPTPNTLGIKLGALLLPVVLVGVIAAVALPAYQQYKARAEARAAGGGYSLPPSQEAPAEGTRQP